MCVYSLAVTLLRWPGPGLVPVRQNGEFGPQPITSRSLLSHQFHGWSRWLCLWASPPDGLRGSVWRRFTLRGGLGWADRGLGAGRNLPGVVQEVQFLLKSISSLRVGSEQGVMSSGFIGPPSERWLVSSHWAGMKSLRSENAQPEPRVKVMFKSSSTRRTTLEINLSCFLLWMTAVQVIRLKMKVAAFVF